MKNPTQSFPDWTKWPHDRWLLRKLIQGCVLIQPRESASALVFAPHPDDETLGCGGTIAEMVNRGSRVGIVFMTNGGLSHPHLMAEKKMARIRTAEARSAAQILGVQEKRLWFLHFRERELIKQHKEAVDRVRGILDQDQCDEIFVPYFVDGNADHVATNRIVIEAVRSISGGKTIYEYPVWFWNSWPWNRVAVEQTIRRNIRVIADQLAIGFRLFGFRDFSHRVFVGDVLNQKRSALEKHASQMTQYDGNAAWKTLWQVSDGGFLEMNLQEYEIFRRYRIS